MALELKQNVKLAQTLKLKMTPQLKQAIRLLQLSRLELTDTLRTEMEQNPMLEEVQPVQEDIGNPEALSATEEAQETDHEDITRKVEGEGADSIGEVNWDDYANNFDADLSFAHETPPADAPSQFDFISARPGLTDHLRWQLMPLQLNDQDRKVTEFIIGNLDHHGYLEPSLPEIAAACACTEAEAEEALRLVQSLDPAGVGARDLRECLLLQLEHEDREDDLATAIVTRYMALLESRNYARLAKELGTSLAKVHEAVDHIRALNPYPGNEYDNGQTHYVEPDVYVFKSEGQFVIQLNEEGLPHLRLTEDYLKLLGNRNALPPQTRAFLQENKRDAQWIIKSVEQRHRTLYRVVESLLKFQREFFEKGPLYMKPLVLREVAEDIGMHESTISRVTANKYVHTPQGIYELRYFFNSAVTNADGSTVGAEAIKTRIRQIISAEDSAKPLSDTCIAEMLAEEGIEVARRTVAKYRELMKILPVQQRRAVTVKEKRPS